MPAEVPGSESSIKLGYTETNDAERHDALLEDAHRQIRGGRIGLVLSALAFGSGVGLLPVGLIGRGLCEEDDDCGNGWIAASSALIVSGVIGMGVSGNVFQKGKRKKRNLENKRVETALRLSPTSASVALRF